MFILAIDPLHQLLQLATKQGLLSKLNGRMARFRVSMYADDTIIFSKPTVPDASNLKSLLLNFGLVTGLEMNLQKNSITPISCNAINLDDILSNLPVARTAFPLKYLGLPLTPGQHKKLDFQPLMDKAAGKNVNLEWQEPNSSRQGLPRQISAFLSAGLSPNGHQSAQSGAAGPRKNSQTLPMGGRQGFDGRQMQSQLDQNHAAKGARRHGGAPPGQIRTGTMTSLALAGMDFTRQGLGRDGGTV
jgi:hypothetical protein